MKQLSESYYRLEEIKAEIDDLASEARAIVLDEFPEQMPWCDAYQVFNMTESSNRYDSTFEKLLNNIVSEAQESFDDDDQ